MIDLLKKATYIGVGLASISKDKLDDFVKEIAENTDMSEKEGRQLVKDFIDESKDTGQSVEDSLGTVIKAVLERLDIPSRKEYEALQDRVKALEKKHEKED